jgi:hypothetical protein
VKVESGGDPRAINHLDSGACDVGLMGVHVARCEPAEVERLLDPAYNLRRGRTLLIQKHRACRAHPRWRSCRHGALGAYNPGDPGYAAKVLRAAGWR